MGDLKRKKKPRVEEIDGVLWQLDDSGNKVKKVKRKVKSSAEMGETTRTKNFRTASLSPLKPKQKLSVKEIEGVLYQLDEQGNPVKKVRRKNEIRRAMSQAPARGQLSKDGTPKVLRAQSVGAPLHRQPGEYTDSKGRRVVIEEDGTKTVFGKNGKRLRPKKKDGVEAMGVAKGTRAASERLNVPQSPMRSPIGADGRVAKSERFAKSAPKTGGAEYIMPTPKIGVPTNKHEIAAAINEIDRENIEIKMKLLQAKDQVEDLSTKTQKEKQKNIKALAEADQLRSKHNETTEQNRMLSLKIKNLEARLVEMDQKIEESRNLPVDVPAKTEDEDDDDDHLVTQLAKLRVQNLSLLNKLDSQKAASSNDAKKKAEQIIIMNDKVKRLRSENDKIFSGDADVDFVRMRLMQEKKELSSEIEGARTETRSKVDEMQVTVDRLHRANADLKKQVEKVTLEINEYDDDEIRLAKEMAQAVAQHGTKNAARAKRASIQINNGTQSPRQGFGLGSLSALANASISNIAM